MAKHRRKLAILVALLGMTGIAYLTHDRWRGYAPQWLADQQQGSAKGQEPSGRSGARRGGGSDTSPVAVKTVSPARMDVPVTLDGVGTVKAFNSVTITAQVSGQLIELPFKEGQPVNKGDIIARIDNSTYKAAYDQAVAKRDQNLALLDNARLDLQRYLGLVANNSVTKQTVDTQKASVAQYEAQVRADTAAINSARAMLDYTVITAPISGRIGIRNVDVGNVVQASASSGIVTISQIRPIAVLFNVPQIHLPAIAAARKNAELQVTALAGDMQTVIGEGILDVIDNQIDQATGTVRLKAIFNNETENLWPGAFVNARLRLGTIKGALVLPAAAVQRGPDGAFVYLVDKENKAQIRNIIVRQQDDTQAVIASGIGESDVVITTGFARLTSGAKVEIASPDNVAGKTRQAQ